MVSQPYRWGAPVKIGPSFPFELVAAGIPLDGIGWDPAAGVILACPDAVRAQVDAVLATHDSTKPPPATALDNPTLGDWRVALTLWGRMDDVTARVNALIAATDAVQRTLGKVAYERLNYSNNVLRSQLLQLKDAFGFTAADVDESLYRARQVSLGDLSGVWPLAASS